MWQFTLCSLFAVLSFLSISNAQEKPNIIVFIADDVGMELGCYGYEAAETPNLDKLAADGLKFNNAFLTTSSCSPSRTSLLSGHFAHTIGTEDLHTGINDTTKLLPFYLRKEGYHTGFMLKGHFGDKGSGQFNWSDNGFWPDWARDGTWNDKAVGNFESFVKEAGKKPFFMWIGFVDAHRPFYEDEKIEGNKAPRVIDPKDVDVPPYLVDDAATRQDLAYYYDEVTRMDDQIGKMIGVLRVRKKLNNTLVIFIADNGKPFPRAKGTVYDSGIKTPLLMYWKGRIMPGTVYDSLISAINLAPTLLDVAGHKGKTNMYGKSMRSIFEDQYTPGDQYIFAERNWHGTDEHIRAIRSVDYLLIMNSYIHLPHGTPSDLSTSPSWYSLLEGKKEGTLTEAQEWLFKVPRVKIELYNVKNDPYQLNNLSGNANYLEISNQMTKALVDWMIKTGDHPSDKRQKVDIVDRVSGFPVKGDRKFFID